MYTRLKRAMFSLRGRQLVLTAVFLVAPILFSAHTASALSSPLDETKTTVSSPLQEKHNQLDSLKATFLFKKGLIHEKAIKVQKAQAEVQQVKQTKEQLADSVANIRNEVQQLQAQLAEKQRLEALRIVTVTQYASNSAGNTYDAGYCTWYVKTRRPDIGNNWGDARDWYSSAQSAGFKTGTMAKTNAIGVKFTGHDGHVVYVEKWLGNGQVLISEMNYAGLWSQRTRVADESEFVYIYSL